MQGTTWAEQVEAETQLPPRQEIVKDGVKTVIEYKYNAEDQRVKIVSEYRIETKRVPKSVAARKHWRKFGQCVNDPPGPTATTIVVEDDMRLQFVKNRAGEVVATADEERSKSKIATAGIQCRFCKATDHFSAACPYRQLFEEQQKAMSSVGVGDVASAGAAASSAKAAADEKMRGGAYVPPSLRGGAPTVGRSMDTSRRDDFTVRVTNLSEDTTDEDLKELFKQTGKITRMFLAKDKTTNRSKGFAFVTYENRDDAERAIITINNHKYDHLILKVEWAKPNVN